MFDFNLTDELKSIIEKLAKKDKKRAEIINKKIKQIINSDSASIQHYKNLRHDLKEFKSVHVDSSFVLIFKVDIKNFSIRGSELPKAVIADFLKPSPKYNIARARFMILISTLILFKIIFAFIGPKLAGKNTAAEYISDRLEIPFYTISDTLKEMAALRNLPQTRDNLIILGNELATEKGEEYLSKEILEKIRYAGIIVGMRQLGQIQYLKENSNLVLISIDASPKSRL